MKKKLAVIAIMLVLITVSLVNTVSAASFTTTMTPTATTVEESNEFVVTIKVSNLDVGTTGINTFEGVLSYSTQVFETLGDDSIEGTDGWQPTYNQDTGKLMLYKQGFLNEDSEIVQITFKTKTNVTGKTGDIKLTDIKASNTGETIEAQSVSTRITIGTPAPSNPGNTTQNTNKAPSQIQQTNKNTNANSNSNISRNVNKNNTNTNAQNSYVDSNRTNSVERDDDIPYTGASDNIMRAIFVVLVIAGISYFKYESIKEK